MNGADLMAPLKKTTTTTTKPRELTKPQPDLFLPNGRARKTLPKPYVSALRAPDGGPDDGLDDRPDDGPDDGPDDELDDGPDDGPDDRLAG